MRRSAGTGLLGLTCGALDRGWTLVSTDHDFRRFSGVGVLNPTLAHVAAREVLFDKRRLMCGPRDRRRLRTEEVENSVGIQEGAGA